MTADQSFRFEERRSSDRTLGLAFAVSIGLHLGAIALYGVLHASPGMLRTEPIASLRERFETVINVTPMELQQILVGQESAAEGGSPGRGAPGGESAQRAAARTGIPVPSVDDSLAEGTLVSSVGLIPLGDPAGVLEASARSHDGPRQLRTGRVAAPTPVPAEEVILFDGIEPQIDLASLERSIVYPETARRNGIEGTVVMKVLVDEQGKAAATLVEHSDSRLLESAAIDAARNARYTPGSQQGRAVAVWIIIPVKFRLR